MSTEVKTYYTTQIFLGKYMIMMLQPYEQIMNMTPKETQTMTEMMPHFRDMGCEFYLCTPQNPLVAMQTCTLHKTMPILCDPSMQITTKYGCRMPHHSLATLTMRGTFIIDPKGMLRYMNVNDAYMMPCFEPTMLNDLMKTVKCMKDMDMMPRSEVCPAMRMPNTLTKTMPPSMTNGTTNGTTQKNGCCSSE
jgi:peroxiredoxin 3